MPLSCGDFPKIHANRNLGISGWRLVITPCSIAIAIMSPIINTAEYTRILATFDLSSSDRREFPVKERAKRDTTIRMKEVTVITQSWRARTLWIKMTNEAANARRDSKRSSFSLISIGNTSLISIVGAQS